MTLKYLIHAIRTLLFEPSPEYIYTHEKCELPTLDFVASQLGLFVSIDPGIHLNMIAKILLLFCLSAVAYASHHGHHEEHHHHHPQPYKFGYEIKDHHGSQHRHEHGDGHGHVQGSYGFTDHSGIHREVHYVADKQGFRATVKTNEPGTANQDPAHVKLHSNAQHVHHHDGHHHGHHHHGHQHHGHVQVHHQQRHSHHGHHHG
ncbi:hypothetical protein CDAR_571161 [Caerostris darwini]|uniref:Uncharacterized protein n=1 Tax=Caerostris darwini TaxID=1538125 RepID=A0AAV4SHL3_9ARAC|nr:hypothetical protein CDAR_571161 [Caerostris darwini]